MLIVSLCPKCQAEHELSDQLLGQTIYCQKCQEPFEVKGQAPKPETKTFGIQSVFGEPEAQAGHAKSSKSKMRLKAGKHALVLPPPPKESWTGKSTNKKEEQFREFRHDSRAVEEFLQREQGPDYSGVLMAGMIFSTLIVLGFLALLAGMIFVAASG